MQITKTTLSKVVEQITEMPISVAEKAIDDIAHRKGDEYVKEILENLSPVKIVAILREHDFSSPSIISLILSPEVIVKVLRIDPLFWKSINDENNSGNFYKIQNDALDLLTSLLLNIDDKERQGEIVQLISCDSLSLPYILLPFIDSEIKEEQTQFLDDPDIDFGTSEHLFEIIRWVAPDVAKKIFNFIYSRPVSLFNYITDLWSEVFECYEEDADYKSVETMMFLPFN